MKITPLKEHPEFIPTLAKWHHDQWIDLNPGDSVEDRLTRYVAHLESNDLPKMFVAVSENVLLGSASLVPHDMETRMELTPWLASLYVAAEHRRQGVGSALVKHVVDEARRRGYRTLYLFTLDQQALYESLGWSTLEKTEYHGSSVEIMNIYLV